MTTISVPGKIIALEVDETGDFDISAASGGAHATPTAIVPSGKPNTVVRTSLGAGNTEWFQLDSSFNVGDIVELYAVSGYFAVMDENGTQLGSASSAGARLRKISTGSSPTWGRVSD
jgi:hypothetical protein